MFLLNSGSKIVLDKPSNLSNDKDFSNLVDKN